MLINKNISIATFAIYNIVLSFTPLNKHNPRYNTATSGNIRGSRQITVSLQELLTPLIKDLVFPPSASQEELRALAAMNPIISAQIIRKRYPSINPGIYRSPFSNRLFNSSSSSFFIPLSHRAVANPAIDPPNILSRKDLLSHARYSLSVINGS